MAQAKADKKPNILILWGDDIGIWNISHFSRGMMGYRTPNIDRIAEEGVTFTDFYGQQSCTAGRACFITGQNPIRTGLTKVGMPGATVGLQAEDPTIAEMLKPLGYATGQFGKNHLGDRDEYLPTVHGFDEFFGNLYHLNAEEEPELPDYPKDPAFKKRVRSARRSALRRRRQGRSDDHGHRSADQEADGDDRRGDHVEGRSGGWRSRSRPTSRSSSGTTRRPCTSGPTSPRRTSARADRIRTAIAWSCTTSRSARSSRSSMSWASPTTPSSCTPPTTDRKTTRGRTARTRRSAARRTRNWEGGWRVPCFMRWPGKIKASTVLNGIVSHIDMFPTLLAIAGDPDVTTKLLNGCTVGEQDVQGASRRLQHGAVLHGRSEGEPAGRPSSTSATTARSSRCASATTSSTSPSNARTRCGSGSEPFVKLRATDHHQPAPRSVRARRLQLEHVLGLDGRSRAADVSDAEGRGGADQGLRASSRRGRSLHRSTSTR